MLLGSIIGAALGMMHLPIVECMNIFRSTAVDVFYKVKGLAGRAGRMMRFLLKGAKYSSVPFHNALRKVFADLPIRGTGDSSAPEILRVGITATDSLAQLVLFRSYNKPRYNVRQQTEEVENSCFVNRLWQV